MTLALTITEPSQWLTSLSILVQNPSGGDSVALGSLLFPLPSPPGISIPANTSPETTRRIDTRMYKCKKRTNSGQEGVGWGRRTL